MVQKKSLDNRSPGLRVPVIPRAPRSARKRSLHKNTADGRNICAIELLACLAGKLLQETESSASNTASEGNDQLSLPKNALQDQFQGEDKSLKSEGQGSCEDGLFILEQASEDNQQKDFLKRSPEVESGALWDRSSVYTNSSCLEKENSDDKSVIISKSGFVVSGDLNSDKLVAVKEQVPDETFLKDSMADCAETPCFPNAFSSRQNIGMVLDRKDDDENFPRFYKSSSTKLKPYKPSSHIVNGRIRKLSTSKNTKVAPLRKDTKPSKSGTGRKVSNQKRRPFYSRERYQQHGFLQQRRKVFDGSCIVTSDGVLSSESDSTSHQIGVNGETMVSSLGLGDRASFEAKNPQVKISIKSFKIPELSIDVPETATVGSLKRTIMEAVTTILGGGLHVGVLLRGKKIHDDNRTLLQTGISSKENLDTLGFILESSLTQSHPSSITPQDSTCTLPCHIPEQLKGSLDKPVSDSEACDSASNPANLTGTCNDIVDSTHELTVSSNTDNATDKPLSDSRALVPVPEINPEPLAIVPANQKGKHPELSHRRIRRPFSVSEVEALVQAVEQLGTGRWRDVKLRAFENADHRTYVDLKDKWKTLVHTASIAPQQRRGEPVPQDLLDRVLSAHSYWSQHQSKQNGKASGRMAQTPPKMIKANAVPENVITDIGG
ncbi:hypothetical protein SAY87_009822 [Trapa incisa]|uniref:Uncharacterized protein n=1 Tax=Trapa incisa TaxID=236973 RepID=A0AAN7Q3E7_9MYRT|nr:hypothetical protein SAY87_009822 [Trapa incisa]